MTLTATAVSHDSPPSRTLITVLVHTGPSLLGVLATLDALRAQTLRPDRIVVLDATTGSGESAPLADDARAALDDSGVEGPDPVMRHVGRLGLRGAVSGYLQEVDADPRELLWIMPGGSVPDERCLSRLVEAHRRSPSVAMVGPKLTDSARPGHLRSAGIRATSSGRIVDDPASGTEDQGQFDERADVLAVPAAGALVEAGLVADLGGWEGLFGDVGSDLDLGWRAQRLGRRVLLAPRAQVLVPDGVGLATAEDGAGRRADRRVALSRRAWWSAPFHALWLLVSSLLTAVALLLLKRPRGAWQAVADLGALEPIHLVRARWRHARRERRRRARVSSGEGVTPARPIRRRDLAALFVSGEEFRRRVTDQVHDAVFPSRSGDEDAPDQQRRSTASRLLRIPGLVALFATLVVLVAAGRSWGGQFFSGLGGGLTGGQLLGGQIGASALWHGWTDTWRGGGLGAAAAAGEPHLGLLALPTRIVEILPGLGSVSSPGGLVIALVVLLAPVLAAVSAYASARVVTDHRWARAAAAVVWALAGAAGPMVAQGRLGPAVALVLLPAVGAGLYLLAGREGTATSAWATALGMGVIGAFTPVLLLLLCIVCVMIVLGARTGGARLRALVPLAVAPLLLGPWWLAVRDDPRLLLAGPGATNWGVAEPPWWQLVLLHPGGAGSTPYWLTAPLVVLAAVGLLRARDLSRASSGAALLVVAGLIAVLAAPRLVLATIPQVVAEAGGRVTVWAGVPMMLLELGLLAAALCAVAPSRAEALTGWWGTNPRATRTLARAGLALLAGTGLALGGALVHAPMGNELSAWRDPRPAVAVEHTDGDVAGRTLFLVSDGDRLGYQLVSREVGDVARSLPVDRRTDATLAPAVSALLEGQPEASVQLGAAAVGILGLPESADPSLRRALDASDGLTRLVAKDGWDYWRIAAQGDIEHRPVAPPRLALIDDSSTAVPTTGQHAATTTEVSLNQPATLVVAEADGWADHAVVRVDDQVVRATGANPSYAVPAGTHSLSIRLDEQTAPWRRMQVVLIAAVIFLAIPFGSRVSRRRA